MALSDADLHELTNESALLQAAQAGVEPAFDELYRRHAEVVWHLAWALATPAGDETLARSITAESFARTFTALAAGRGESVDFATLLRNQTLTAAADRSGGAAPTAAGHIASNRAAAAFATLPDTWRAALWLTDGEQADAAAVAGVLGLDADETVQLIARARVGWRERYLRHHVATTVSRICSRAVARLSDHARGTLSAADVTLLERHLDLCEDCSDCRAAMVGIDAELRAMAPALPVLLVDDVRRAWSATVVTPTRRRSISGRTEKALAGATALVAALGVVGAAIFGANDAGSAAVEPIAAPVAPIVTDVSSPLPIELATAVDLPPKGLTPNEGGLSSAVVTGLAAAGTAAAPVRVDLSPQPSAKSGTPGAGDPGDGNDGIGNEGPGDGGDLDLPETPVPTVPTAQASLGGAPVAIAVGDQPGVTVGPISAGDAPAPREKTEVQVGGPLAPAQPTVETVTGLVG